MLSGITFGRPLETYDADIKRVPQDVGETIDPEPVATSTSQPAGIKLFR
jgi:hypothetical protein